MQDTGTEQNMITQAFFIDTLNIIEVSKICRDFHYLLDEPAFCFLGEGFEVFFFLFYFFVCISNILQIYHEQLKVERAYLWNLNVVKMHCFVETETLQMSEYSSNHFLCCTEEQNQISKH